MSAEDFGEALRHAREAAGLTQAALARHLKKTPVSAHRWETQGVRPPYEARVEILRFLAKAPRPLLEALADMSDVDLDSVLPLPPAPVPVPPAPHVAAAPPLPAKVMLANAQTLLDDAVREAAEDLDVSPRVLRPVLSRLLDRAARAGVPVDAAARMVLGVPKKDPDDKKRPATTGA
jgi:hypothetical protein